MKKIFRWVYLILVLGSELCFAQTDEITFKIGDEVPRIDVVKWLKGVPFAECRQGHVYIIEFGSIACIPCRAAIPHLTELTDKYKNEVTVLSVYVSESDNSRVEKFINNQKDDIHYSVAIDDSMRNTWMKSSGREGIPVAFVIDQFKRLVWIGNPSYLDDVISKVVKNEFDPNLELLKSERRQRREFDLSNARKNGALQPALIIIDSLIQESPKDFFLYKLKFQILLESDEEGAYMYGWKLLKDELKNLESPLHSIAREIIDNSIKLDRPDWKLAKSLTERALVLSRDDLVSASILCSQAEIFFKLKDYKMAVQTQSQAIKYLNAYPESSSGTQRYFLSKLEAYKKMANL